ncbi:MAG: hypothetical protein AB7V08_13800 [Elusimicrobiales bacterium]
MVIPSSFCTDPSTDPALAFVSGGYDTFVNLARDSYELAIEQTNALNNFEVQPLEFNVSFNFDGQLAPFQRPIKPELNLDGLNFQDPGTVAAPPTFEPGDIPLEDAPTFDQEAPLLAFGAKPAAPAIVAPTMPALNEPTIPLEPDYVLPEVPTFEQLNLPTPPSIALPTFTAVAPTFNVPDLTQEWSFNPEEYASGLLDATKAKILEWYQGGTGLPEAIEDALFDRAMGRVDQGNTADLQLARDIHSSLGFTEPNGLLNGRVMVVMQKGKDERAKFSRELTIRFHEEELVNMRQAVQQGIALEQVLINLHVEEQRLLLSAAQFLRESEVAVLNARVAIFNAQLSAYQTEAQVLEARIRAELAKVEVFKAQIEGERVRGEINEQRVRQYEAQIRAVQAMADFYRTRVEAVQAETEINRQRVLVFQAQTDAFAKRWDAYGRQLDAYRADIDGQKAIGEIYESSARAFASRVNAFDVSQRTRYERERLRVTAHGQQLQAWRGQLDVLLALIQKEQGRISSVAQSVDAQARMYQADAAVETAASAATDRSFELGLRKEEARTSVALKQAEVKIQEAIQLLQVLLRARETQAQVIGQLSSSAMSAVNFSAGLSSSRSKGESCSTSVSWSGEATDLE